VSRRASSDLSGAAQEYLLALRSAAVDGARATAATVARHVGVSTQAASEMYRRLAGEDLVCQGEGRELTLTQPGRAAADGIFRRHALLEWLLISVVGLGWAESDEEAARLQGAISPRVEARLDELLGHPETCPHGNPVDAAIAARRPAGVSLASLEAGDVATVYRITETAEEDPALLSYLEARALTPGVRIEILARSASLDAVTLEGPIGRATLGLRPASLIRVLRGEPDPSLFHRVPGRLRTG
jgi:DtxR family Mn-dependent transcriptional regulator